LKFSIFGQPGLGLASAGVFHYCSLRRDALRCLLVKANPMTASAPVDAPPPVPQPVTAPLTRAAIFLVVTVNAGTASVATVTSFCADLGATIVAMGRRRPMQRTMRMPAGCSRVG